MGAILLIYCYNKLIEKTGKRLAIFQWDAAENVITDKIALTKKKNGLAKIFGKFRKGTINRKDQIFSEIAELVKK